MADADPYAYCDTLTRDQWAWEFLRRNPDYRRDYLAFITIWRALEAAYGAPPNRDFSRWKRDPRAYGPLPGNAELATPSGEQCTVDDERVLLECWMGAKWGFYKFPLDPARVAPATAAAHAHRRALPPRPDIRLIPAPAAATRSREIPSRQPRRRTAPPGPRRAKDRSESTHTLDHDAASARL